MIEKIKPRDKELFIITREKIISDVSGKHTLGELARASGMNRNKLTRGFRALFAVSIRQFIIRSRMQAAKKMLRESDLPVKAIAAACGYDSMQNFITAFRQHSGQTPLQYRRAVQQQVYC